MSLLGYSSVQLTELRDGANAPDSNSNSNSGMIQVVERHKGSSILRVNFTEDDGGKNSSIRLGRALVFQAISTTTTPTTSNTDADPPAPTRPFLSPVLVSVAMSHFLGVEHFNRRYFPFQPQLAERIKDCDFYFSVENHDTQASPLRAGTLMSRAIWGAQQQQPTLVVGPTTSDVTPILATLGAVAGSAENGSPIPNFSGTASAALLEDVNSYPYFGRLIPLEYGEAAAACALFQSWKVTHVGVLSAQGAYGEGQLTKLRKVAAQFGITFYEQSYKIGIEQEVRSAVNSLKKSGLQYFLGVFATGTVTDVLPVIYDMGLIGNPEYMWVFTLTTRANLALVQTQGNLEGMTFQEQQIFAKALNGTAMVDFSTRVPNPDTFQEEFRQYFWNDTSLADYESMFSDGPNFTAWDRALSSNSLNFLSYDVGTAVGLAACEADSEFFDGPQLFESFKRVAFNGSSGYIAFDSATGTRSTAPFPMGVYNIQSRIHEQNNTVSYIETEPILLAMNDPKRVTVEQVHPFVFPDGSGNAPAQFPAIDEDQNLVGTGAMVFILTISIVIALCSAGAGFWTWRNQELARVKIRQGFFLSLLCSGTFIMACSSLPLVFQDSMATFSNSTLSFFCMLRPWLFSLGFIISYSALFAKSRRVFHIFKSAMGFRRVKVTHREVLLPLFFMAAVDIILLTAWTVIAPLTWQRVVVSTDLFGRVTESYGTCRSEKSIAFALPIILILLGALLVSNYQSLQARKLPDVFQESASLLFTNFILLECIVLGLPVLAIVVNNPTASAVIQSIIMVVLCLAILLPYFPRLMTMKENERKRHMSLSANFCIPLDDYPNQPAFGSAL